jgi:hypothetical protein
LFLNPSQVGLEPPGYVTQMYSRNFLPNPVKCDVTGAECKLDANAKCCDRRGRHRSKSRTPFPSCLLALRGLIDNLMSTSYSLVEAGLS